MALRLPTTFPKSPAAGERRDRENPDLFLRIPMDPTAEVALEMTFVVGETKLGGEVKYQRPVFWLEAEGTDDARFDFAVCGLLVTADEVKLQHGLRERPAPQHPQRLRTRLGTKIDTGERVTFKLTKSADGGAVLLHGSDSSGRQAIGMPAATRIVALHVGRPGEGDFPKVGGQRDKTQPGAWQPLYDWVLEDLTINGQRVGEATPRSGDETGPGDETSRRGGPEPPIETGPSADPGLDLQTLRAKLRRIRGLADEALAELEGL